MDVLPIYSAGSLKKLARMYANSLSSNWLTFDIIGDLSFGEPFGAVAEGTVSGP